MMMETSKPSRLRPVPSVTLLVRDAPVQLPTSARVATRASSSRAANVSPVPDVSQVRSKWTLPILSASRMTELDVKSARTAPTLTAIDVLTPLLVTVCSARRVTLEPRLVPVSSAPRAALSAKMRLLV